MICLYHRVDFDGKCSGAIVKNKYPECRLYGIDYGDKLDLSLIGKKEAVLMVDFTFEKSEVMKTLCDHANLMCWIDHHKTALSVENELNLHYIPGIRQVTTDENDPEGKDSDYRISACELTWNYLYPDRKVPYSVWLLGRYDIWNEKNPLWKTEILPFQYGMRLQHSYPDDQNFWKPHFITDESSEVVKDMLVVGGAALAYDKNISEKMAHLWFPIEFKGFKFQAINRSLGNSLSGASVWDSKNYDAIMYFCRGPNIWKITMFTDKEGVDLYPLAKSLGGGGHSQACGFTTNNIMELLPQLIEF